MRDAPGLSDPISFSVILENLVKLLLVLLAAAALAGLGALLFKAVTASGEISYCYVYVESMHSGLPPAYKVTGFRPWRQDRHIATFASIQEAADVAAKIGCPLR